MQHLCRLPERVATAFGSTTTVHVKPEYGSSCSIELNHTLRRLCGPPPIRLSFSLAAVVPRRACLARWLRHGQDSTYPHLASIVCGQDYRGYLIPVRSPTCRLSVGDSARGRLRHWCSSRSLRIPPLHREFHPPLLPSSPAVLLDGLPGAELRAHARHRNRLQRASTSVNPDHARFPLRSLPRLLCTQFWPAPSPQGAVLQSPEKKGLLTTPATFMAPRTSPASLCCPLGNARSPLASVGVCPVSLSAECGAALSRPLPVFALVGTLPYQPAATGTGAPPEAARAEAPRLLDEPNRPAHGACSPGCPGLSPGQVTTCYLTRSPPLMCPEGPHRSTRMY